jgi:hypothetical protein
MADSLGRNLDSDTAKADLRGRGVTDTYNAMIADNAQAPLMWLTVTGTEPARVLAEDKVLTAYAAERLEQFQTQQSVPQNAMIRMVTIVSPQTPVAQTKTRIEYTVLAAVLGLALSLVATFFVEARRRPRPATDPHPAADPQPGAEPQPAVPQAAEPHPAGAAPAVPSPPDAEAEPVPARPGPAQAEREAAAHEPEPESPTVSLAALPTSVTAPARQRSSWFG